jgi:hypothetical protein
VLSAAAGEEVLCSSVAFELDACLAADLLGAAGREVVGE